MQTSSTHVDWVEALEEFHNTFGLGWHTESYIAADDVAMLRVKLMISELSELVDAMAEEDAVKIADGIIDLLYVTIGTGGHYGVPMKKVFDQVHKNNMTKMGADGKIFRDYSGKIQKPPGYKPVDLSWILDM